MAEVYPRAVWAEARFCDPFSGGGAVALFAKAQGFTVIAADLAERALIVGRALIANPDARVSDSDVLRLFAPPPAGSPAVAAAHAPVIFTPTQAAWIDGALAQAAARPEPVRSLLRLVILKVLLRSQPMSLLTASDAGAAATGDYDRVSPRRLTHYLRAERQLAPARVLRVAADVNWGVLGGRGRVEPGDARAVLAATAAEVVYLDPPYVGTSRYDQEYAVLDALLGDSAAERDPPSLDAARHAEIVVLSYRAPRDPGDPACDGRPPPAGAARPGDSLSASPSFGHEGARTCQPRIAHRCGPLSG